MYSIITFLLTDGKYYSSAYFGAGSGKIWLEDVACTTSNTKLLQCSSSPIGEETCSHSEDAGVGCEGVLLAVFHSLLPCLCIFHSTLH